MSKPEERLSGALQENILVLLCFSKKAAKQARAPLTPQLFESAVFREIAGAAIDFIDQFGEPIGEHLPDTLEHVLKGEDTRKAATYKRVMDNLFLAQDGINDEYVMSQLHKFVRQQNLKDGFRRAVEAFEEGNIDGAETALNDALRRQSLAFEAGMNLSKPADAARLFASSLDQEGFTLGIKELDRVGIMPRRKEMLMFVAPRKRGKSWFCTHVAKRSLLQRWSTCIITLEMSEGRYSVRFVQSFFSVSKREARVRLTKLVQRDGKLVDIIHEEVDRITLEDEGINVLLEQRVKRSFKNRPPMVVKEFPTGSLTVEELDAWLDGMEMHEGISFDTLIIDYPDLMKHNVANKRLELGQIVERIRGIGVKRNQAIVVVTQGNRESETAQTVTADMAAEDISKLATADVALTYSQTPAEKKLGLARILVGAARNDSDGFSVLITQAYGIGQFCLDSMLMSSETYWPGTGEVLTSEDLDRERRERERGEDRPVADRPRQRATTRPGAR